MMLIKENLPVIIERHPRHESLNTKILKDARDFGYSEGQLNKDGGVSNVKAPKTVGRKVTSPAIELIYDWILLLLKSKSENKGWSFEVDNSWLAWYRDNEFTIKHHHYPADYAFVYFVKCPKGSSPLIFSTSGKRIKAEEGKVVIFPGNLCHHVPKNKCDGRIVLAGNVFASLK